MKLLITLLFILISIPTLSALDIVATTKKKNPTLRVKIQGVNDLLKRQIIQNLKDCGWFSVENSAFANYTLNDPRILESTNSAEEGNELSFRGADSLNLGISYETSQGLYAGILMHSLSGYPTK